MSEHSTPEERTEMPTDRRMGELRKTGGLHSSTEVVVVTSLLSGFLCLYVMWSWFVQDMKDCMIKAFAMIGDSEPLDAHSLYDGMLALLLMFGPEVAILSIIVAFFASMSLFLQTNFNVKSKWIDIKFSQLNPMNGISRVFSTTGAVNTLKALFKLALILPIGYFALKRFSPEMIALIHLSVDEVLAYIGDACMYLFWKIMYVLIAFAIFDYFWSKFQWLKQNKMTKVEVKDERKAIEGDEATKRKIQQKGLQRIMQRIQESVPQADVVITNPTHYSVALSYDRDKMSAPRVVAKGRGHLALRIREIARESGVPMVERKPLARALYASVEVGSEIPGELFKAVAEVLAYVYKLKNPYKYMNAGAS